MISHSDVYKRQSPVMAQDFKIGICNYVDDASLNQIVDNIQSRLEEIGKEKDVNFEVSYDCLLYTSRCV